MGKQKYDTNSFIIKSNLIHNNFYNYSKTNYVSFNTPVIITCPIHGDFMLAADKHFYNRGCPECGNTNKGKTLKNLAEQRFFKKILEFSSNYSYEESVYLGWNNKIKIKCLHCENYFWMTPNNHLRGKGCNECSKYNPYRRTEWIENTKKKNRQACLYFIKVYDKYESFYKIGITNRPINQRFGTANLNHYSYEIIREVKLTPESVWDVEKHIMLNYKYLKYKPIRTFGGHLECFFEINTILENLDNIIINNCLHKNYKTVLINASANKTY